MVTMEKLETYTDDVTVRADHHAKEVQAVFYALYGYVLAYGKDLRIHKGRTKEFGNTVWFVSRKTGKRYAFSFDHDTRLIVLKRGGIQGSVVMSFDNDTPLTVIKTVFDRL